MSVFLIWGSIGRSTNFRDYLKKRFWRIYPELWVAVSIELIVLIILHGDSIKWSQFMLFSFTQSTIFQFWTPDCLRSYGCGCPNGALWTICVLIQFYFFAYFLYKWLHGKKIMYWIITLLASILLSYLLINLQQHIPVLIGKLLRQTLLPYLWMFIFASLFAEKKATIIPYLETSWPLFFILTLAVSHIGFDLRVGYNLLHTTCLFLCLAGFAYRFHFLDIKTDISYGIYIYHMTIVNVLINFGFSRNQWLMVFVILSSCLVAWISAATIGKYSIIKKYS